MQLSRLEVLWIAPYLNCRVKVRVRVRIRVRFRVSRRGHGGLSRVGEGGPRRELVQELV